MQNKQKRTWATCILRAMHALQLLVAERRFTRHVADPKRNAARNSCPAAHALSVHACHVHLIQLIAVLGSRSGGFSSGAARGIHNSSNSQGQLSPAPSTLLSPFAAASPSCFEPVTPS